ncbi:Putative tRNA pseudouridine synthase [Galdieria sulphuraria]|nr:Putative tRNA pseudouridine synthase [Galdieria sulphuraria]
MQGMQITSGFATTCGKGPLLLVHGYKRYYCGSTHILKILSGQFELLYECGTNMEKNSQNLSAEEGRVKLNRQEGIKTIEEEIERALYSCGWIGEQNFRRVQKISWSRASRTDKGVHACGNVIALKALLKEQWFELDSNFEKTKQNTRTKNNSDELAFSSLGSLKKDVLEQLNRNLPDSIRILGVQPVTKHFDARSRCNFRAYEYLMPLEAIPGASENIEQAICRLEEILSLFKGTHRFHNFSSGLRAAHKKANARLEGSDPGEEFTTVRSEQVSSTEADIEERNIEDANNKEQSMKKYEENDEIDIEDNQEMQFSDYLCKVIRQWPEHSSHRLKRQEYIRSVYIADIEGPLEIQGRNYVLLRFAGQSFILHQIRKMIGGALSVMYGRLSMEALKVALYGPFQVPISLAPSEPLMLVLCDFWNSKRERYELIPSPVTQEAMKHYKYKILLPRVAELLEQKRPFERFFVEGLYDYGGNGNLQRLITKFHEWDEKRRQRKVQNVTERNQASSTSQDAFAKKTFNRRTERPLPPKLFTQLAVELRMLPGPELCRIRQALVDARRCGMISQDPSTQECIQYLKQKQYL